MRKFCARAFLAVLFVPTFIHGQTIPAFPGADGAAANVSGGRGGLVYHVTKINSAIDDPARNDIGTLRYGLNNTNFSAGVPRTIVFDVGGVFHLGRLPQDGWDPNGNGWDTQSRLTIGGTNITFAGQTAPGAGVIFMGGGLKPQGNNNIFRNVTVAAGYGMRNWWDPGDPFPDLPGATADPAGWFPDNTVYDAMDIAGTNLMIDHVSAIYATDEAISMNEVANNITVQYSNISQGQNYPQWDAENPTLSGHAYGSLLEAGNSTAQAAISFHHNFYAHQKARVPQLQSQSGSLGAFYDFRNNVFYNWFGTAGSKSGATSLNLINNFYLAGDGGDQPAGGSNPAVNQQGGGTSVMSASGTVYRNGNLLDSNKDADANDGNALSAGGAANSLWRSGVVTYNGTTDTAANAFERVLDYVGANWWNRDDVIDTPDERIIHEARTGTGKIIAWADDPWNNDPAEGVEWRTLKDTPQVSRTVDWDTETSVGYGVGDGMPSSWELEHGLDPNARDDAGDFDSDGYTNLEEYLNDIAAWPAPNAIAFNNANGDGRFSHILNWDANPNVAAVHPWQPSRYDTAVINNGTITVDAVGQHAGNVLLATNAGDNATLNFTAGWLKVEDAPHGLSDGATIIGDNNSATATLNLSGGKLTTKMLLKGDGGAFNFTGGVLAADVVGFDLVNQGGTIAPGNSPGITAVMGNLTMESGGIEIEITGNQMGEYDAVLVDGLLTAGGTLEVVLDGYSPAAGDEFSILGFESAVGNFAYSLPALAGGLLWDTSQVLTTGLLTVFVDFPPTGDFDNDGDVDGRDFLIWQRGESPHPHSVDELAAWEANYGAGELSASTAIPEPGAIGLLMLGLAGLGVRWQYSSLPS
jgi:hypothetical protein